MKTFIVVFIAVLFANISSLVLYELYQQYQAKNYVEVKALEVVEKPEEPDVTLIQPSNSKIAEEQRLKALQASAENLCDYWTNVVEKEPTGLNEALKNKACLRHKKLQPATPSEE